MELGPSLIAIFGLAIFDWGGQITQIRVSQGDGLMNRNVVALFGAVALLLTATVTLTLSRATVSVGSTGSLKCYSTGGTEKAC